MRATGRARVPLPGSTGVFNPILDQWTVPPQDKRMIEGLSYSPRGVFKTYGRTA